MMYLMRHVGCGQNYALTDPGPDPCLVDTGNTASYRPRVYTALASSNPCGVRYPHQECRRTVL